MSNSNNSRVYVYGRPYDLPHGASLVAEHDKVLIDGKEATPVPGVSDLPSDEDDDEEEEEDEG